VIAVDGSPSDENSGLLEPCIIALSSKIGAGKSTLARELSRALGIPRISFGEYVRSVARKRGLPESRSVLQEIGESLVEADASGFASSVLSASWKQGAVVDGIRHVKVLHAIREIVSPLPVLLVYVEVDEHIRKHRLAQRGMRPEEINAADDHSMEQQVRHTLRGMAALRVSGDADPAVVVRLIAEALQRLQT
jgi:dephospho-CoA kinase